MTNFRRKCRRLRLPTWISHRRPPKWSEMSCSLASQVSPGVPVMVRYLALVAGVSCTHWIRPLSSTHCWFPTPHSSEWRLMRVPSSRPPHYSAGLACVRPYRTYPLNSTHDVPLQAASGPGFHTQKSLSSNCSHSCLIITQTGQSPITLSRPG